MKINISHIHVLTSLTMLLLGTACNGPDKKGTPQENEHSQLIKNVNAPHTLDLRCSLEDKHGNLWFGTRETGLYKYDGNLFTQFTVNDGLDCNNIYRILEDRDGKKWIGTELGLCIYDGKTFNKIQIPLPKNLPPNNNPLYQTHWVLSMIQAKDRRLWFVTIDGVYIYNGKSFTHFPIDEAKNGFLNDNAKVERILEDKEGNIWFGGRTNEGVFRYDGKIITNIKLPELIQNENTKNARPHSWGWPQLQDRNGNIWFSNWGGVYRYDGKSFTSFSKKDGITGAMIADIIEDKKGNIWFSGDGLYCYDGKSVSRYTSKDKQVNLGGWSILEDRRGKIWVGTKKGFYIFNGKEFISY